MDTGNRTELSRWVEERAAALAPPAGWEPNVDLARARFESRRSGHPVRGRQWLAGAVVASMICAALVLVPGTRALAQQLWRWITIDRIEVVKVDFDSLPDDAKSLSMKPINTPGPPQVVAGVDEATRRAGFAVRLPRSRCSFGYSPSICTGADVIWDCR